VIGIAAAADAVILIAFATLVLNSVIGGAIIITRQRLRDSLRYAGATNRSPCLAASVVRFAGGVGNKAGR
jgi:hypothetical protein